MLYKRAHRLEGGFVSGRGMGIKLLVECKKEEAFETRNVAGLLLPGGRRRGGTVGPEQLPTRITVTRAVRDDVNHMSFAQVKCRALSKAHRLLPHFG